MLVAAAWRRGLLNALPACLLIFFLSLPTVSSLGFQGLEQRCEAFDDGSLRLPVDYSVDCHSSSSVFRLAQGAIVVYGVCLPLVIMLLLHMARGPILSQRPSNLSRALDFLHRDLEPRCYW